MNISKILNEQFDRLPKPVKITVLVIANTVLAVLALVIIAFACYMAYIQMDNQLKLNDFLNE